MSDNAVIMLGGMVVVMKGPTTRVGMMLMRSMPFSLANSHAAFSARDLDTKYICRTREIPLRSRKRSACKAREEDGKQGYPSGHLDAAAEVDVAPGALVVLGLLLLLHVDGTGGGSEDDAPDRPGFLAGPHDAQHSVDRGLDDLVLQKSPPTTHHMLVI